MMKQLVDCMSDDEAVILETKLSDNDGSYRRLAAYAAALYGMMGKGDTALNSIDPQGKNTAVMKELSFVICKHDYKEEICETINGNEFIFKKSFPIDQYHAELAEIGEEEKGNRWYVQLDEDGRLVIY